jgi:hypothetical protein
MYGWLTNMTFRHKNKQQNPMITILKNKINESVLQPNTLFSSTGFERCKLFWGWKVVVIRE